MKTQWSNLSKEIQQFNTLLGQIVDTISEKKYQKGIATAVKQWNKLVAFHNEFDKLVQPVTPLTLKLPFQSTEFTEVWKLYKEYLEETYQQYIPSRRELMMLRRLAKLSDQDEKRAIDFLEYYICHGNKGIYKPTEKQLSGEEPSKVEEVEQSHFDVNAKRLDI